MKYDDWQATQATAGDGEEGLAMVAVRRPYALRLAPCALRLARAFVGHVCSRDGFGTREVVGNATGRTDRTALRPTPSAC